MLQRAACGASLSQAMKVQAALRLVGSVAYSIKLPPPDGGPNWVFLGMRPSPQRNFTCWRMNACEPVECQIIAAFPATNYWGPSFQGVSAGVDMHSLPRSYQNRSASMSLGRSQSTLLPSAVRTPPALA